jgi:hypothetical protein
MLKRLFKALLGRHFWLKIKRQFDIENGFYAILLPDDDDELNNECLNHIDDMLAFKKGKGAVVLTNNANEDFQSDRITVVDITQKDIENLLSYYEICNFSESFVLVSLKYPTGNDLSKTIGVNGVTKEDIVCLCIFCIRNFTR